MKSKTSFINKGVLRNDFKSFGWISLAYLLGLLLAIPLKILMLYSREETLGFNYDLLNNPYLCIFQFDSAFQLILLLVVPVLTGMLLFRYLQSSKAVDMMHALPIKREILYNTHLSAGIIILFVPVIITALVSWAIINSLGIEYVKSLDIFTWLGISLLINLLLFISSVATGMFTGMSSVQGVLTYILLFLPTGLSLLLLHNIHLYVYGFAYDHYISSINNLSPLMRIAELPHHTITGIEIITYLLTSLALYFVGRYLYQRRQLEMAGNAITFTLLCPIFKYGVTLCSMLVLGSYFNGVQKSMGWTFFGYLLGSLLGYFLAEILINKSLNVFNSKITRGYVVFSLAIILLLSGISHDFTGFEKRLPELAEVESVYFDTSFYNLTRTDNRQELYPIKLTDQAYFYEMKKIYTEEDNIAHIYELHQKIIANKKQEKNRIYNNNNDIPHCNFCLAYKLKNGTIFYRQYNIAPDNYAANLKPIYESLEYKHLHYVIFNVVPENVDIIEINANDVNKNVKITVPVLIKQAISVLKTDAINQTYEEMTSNKPDWASIRILLNNGNRLSISWNKSDVNFGNWLKSIDEYNNARLIPSDIEYAIVGIPDDDKQKRFEKYLYTQTEEYLATIEHKQDYLKITDPEQLETCLFNYTYTYEDDTAYSIFFLLKNGNSIAGGFSQDNTPDFVKSYFIKNKSSLKK